MTDRQERERDLGEVRQLWAGRFQGVLSTHSLAEQGYPFGSVVPYCLDLAVGDELQRIPFFKPIESTADLKAQLSVRR